MLSHASFDELPDQLITLEGYTDLIFNAIFKLLLRCHQIEITWHGHRFFYYPGCKCYLWSAVPFVAWFLSNCPLLLPSNNYTGMNHFFACLTLGITWIISFSGTEKIFTYLSRVSMILLTYSGGPHHANSREHRLVVFCLLVPEVCMPS